MKNTIIFLVICILAAPAFARGGGHGGGHSGGHSGGRSSSSHSTGKAATSGTRGKAVHMHYHAPRSTGVGQALTGGKTTPSKSTAVTDSNRSPAGSGQQGQPGGPDAQAAQAPAGRPASRQPCPGASMPGSPMPADCR